MMGQEEEAEEEEEQARIGDGLGPRLRMRQDGVFKMVFSRWCFQDGMTYLNCQGRHPLCHAMRNDLTKNMHINF